jgi:formylglycine-generating enzyme required for sulfatase activity
MKQRVLISTLAGFLFLFSYYAWGDEEQAAAEYWKSRVAPLIQNKALTKERANACEDIVDTFRWKYGYTKYGESVADELKELNERAGKVLGRPRNISLDLGKGVKMEFVLIKPGTFIMGSPKGQARIQSDGPIPGHPQHKVTLTKAFYMGKCEVTQEQYMQLMKKNPSTFKGKNLPVNKVKWGDAQAFCKKLGEGQGKSVRLPTEAEWEYSCRAGTTSTWYWGEDNAPMLDHAWVRENAAKKTHPVGTKAPNPWGLHDMFGNVSEWVSDLNGKYSKQPVTDPKGPDKGNAHIFRGGGFLLRQKVPRPGDRASQPSNKRPWAFVGFRAAMDVEGSGTVKKEAGK